MTKLAAFALIAAGIIAISAAILGPRADAQTVQPGTPCRGETSGERVLKVARATISLPPGQYGIHIPPPGGSAHFTICHVGSSGSNVTLDYQTCAEVGREVREPSGAAILDRIAASCQVPPQEEHSFCGSGDDPRFFYVVENGGEILIDGRVYVTLPPDRFELRYSDDGPLPGPRSLGAVSSVVNICNRGWNYFVALSLNDCSVSGWSQGRLESSAIIDSISTSCRGATSAAPPTTIQPPSVGNAGLRTDN